MGFHQYHYDTRSTIIIILLSELCDADSLQPPDSQQLHCFGRCSSIDPAITQHANGHRVQPGTTALQQDRTYSTWLILRFSLAPLIMLDKSTTALVSNVCYSYGVANDLRGRSSGKSTLANMMAKKMYQPQQQVTKQNAPEASASLKVMCASPLAALK